jgi:cell division protein FtsW
MKRNLSYLLFFLIAFITGFSLLFFSCLSAHASLERFGNTTHYLWRQLFFGFIPAIVFGFIAYKISLPWLKKWSLLIFLLNIVAAFAVFIPYIGLRVKGATRWINLFGITSIQPAEFLKVTAILYLSAWIASRLPDNIASGWKNITKRGWNNFIQILIPFIIFLGLIAIVMYFQSDISTLGIITFTLGMIYFGAKTPFWHTIFLIASGISTFFIFIKFEPYRLERFLTLFNPHADPLGSGMQIRQSLISLGSGGIFGQGLGMSTQKFGFLPESMTDSIFAIIGEETGIFGSFLLVAAFIALFVIGMTISRKATDKFSQLTAMGIVIWLTSQAFINISAAAGVFPLAGIPLPFFSSGGSHLMAEFVAIGLLLNISKNT